MMTRSDAVVLAAARTLGWLAGQELTGEFCRLPENPEDNPSVCLGYAAGQQPAGPTLINETNRAKI